jgi:hypothetical protein
MDDVESHLNRYLLAEQKLNEFFAALDYCLPRCIAVAKRNNGNRPVAACCQNKYYSICDLPHPSFERLRQEREKRYGRPEDHAWADPVSPCHYHDPENGCLLATHKSPICLAFLCREGIDHLRGRYGIYTYDYLGFYYALEWILTGDLPDKDFKEFVASITAMAAKVKQTACRSAA